MEKAFTVNINGKPFSSQMVAKNPESYGYVRAGFKIEHCTRTTRGCQVGLSLRGNRNGTGNLRQGFTECVQSQDQRGYQQPCGLL